jgi:hemoglobin
VQRPPYDELGGDAFFVALVDAFYRRVDTDPVLRPMYPEDLTQSRHWLAVFLGQYFGGPQAYSEAKGHPRLRMRHVHLAIGRAERDAWYDAMHAAVDELGVAEPLRSAMLEYFDRSADWMINTEDTPAEPTRTVHLGTKPDPTPEPS